MAIIHSVTLHVILVY